jgi:UDP-N-acetylmuramoyl-tripeptide--D-alanyl-D-alanine ligase
MRLDIIRGNKFTIVNDCYNASPDSMKAAIDVLMNIIGKRKIAVLGTMKELGEESYLAHKEVGKYAKEKGIDLLIALGEFGKAYREGFQERESHEKIKESDESFLQFEDYDSVVEFLISYLKKEDVVLFKASRAMKFEKIIEKLKINND